MNNIILIFLYSSIILIFKLVQTGAIFKPMLYSERSNIVFELSAKLLEKCISVGKTKTIVLFDNSNSFLEEFRKQRYNHVLFSIFTISKSFKFPERNPNIYSRSITEVKQRNAPASIFVIGGSTVALNMVFNNLRQSNFWNSKAFFIVLADPSCEECANVYNVLKIAFIQDVYSLVFICSDADEKVKFYTLNPLSSSAPKFWQHAEQYNMSLQKSWKIFSRVLDDTNEDPFICENIFFDKIISTNGYPVNVGGRYYDYLLTRVPNQTGIDKLGGEAGYMWQTVLKHMKVSVNFVNEEYADKGYIHKSGSPIGLLVDIFNKKLDVCLVYQPERHFWEYQTYPHEYSGLCLMTYKNTTFSRILAIRSIFSLESCSVLGAFLITCVAILKFLLMLDPARSFFEALRMLVSIPTSWQPPSQRSSMARPVFGMLLLGNLVCETYFECLLGSLLAHQPNARNIDSVEDLYNSRHIIIGPPEADEFLLDKRLRSRFFQGKLSNCRASLLEGQEVGCLYYCLMMRYYVAKHPGVHIAQDSIRKMHQVFMVREGWPLKDRLSSLLQRLLESGLLQAFRTWEFANLSLKSGEFAEKPTEYKPLTLDQFYLGIYFMILGLLLAFVVFLFENLLSEKRIDRFVT